jgi:hypothetical protein
LLQTYKPTELTGLDRVRSLGAVALLLIFCFVVLAGVARAVVVGVQPGDWITYDVTGPSDVPGQTVHYWAKVTVKDVSSTIVSITMETNLTTLGTRDYAIDIAYDCWIGGAWPYIVPANLSLGDGIPGVPIATINDTTQHFGRDAAHISVVSSEETTDWYWDREKGVLLEMSGVTQRGPMSYTMDSTNMWGNTLSLPGLDWQVFAVIVIVAGVAVAVVAAGLILHSRKRSTTVSQPRFQPPPPPPPKF